MNHRFFFFSPSYIEKVINVNLRYGKSLFFLEDIRDVILFLGSEGRLTGDFVFDQVSHSH